VVRHHAAAPWLSGHSQSPVVTAGGGIEGAFGGGWSAKVEYLYIDLGKLEQTVTIPPAALTATFNSRLTDNIVRVGLNYKWGGGY
jgi:outer membrane immunogenic protein